MRLGFGDDFFCGDSQVFEDDWMDDWIDSPLIEDESDDISDYFQQESTITDLSESNYFVVSEKNVRSLTHEIILNKHCILNSFYKASLLSKNEYANIMYEGQKGEKMRYDSIDDFLLANIIKKINGEPSYLFEI